MDPVMQALFGLIPIEKLNAVQLVAAKNKKTTTIIILGGIALGLGIAAYLLYLKNEELKKKLAISNNNFKPTFKGI